MDAKELLAWFEPSDADRYLTIHSEKGPYDDYFEGKTLPKELVKKFKLFWFNISPVLGLRYKLNHPQIRVRACHRMETEGWQVLVYAIGLGLEPGKAPPDEGVDIHALILTPSGEIYNNLFLGGFLWQRDQEEIMIAREMTFEPGAVVLRVIDPESDNIPSHLKMDEVIRFELEG